MCIQESAKKRKYYQSSLIYLLMVGLGVLSGLSDFQMLQGLGFLISEIFIKIFKCISLPIIALSIIVTLSQYHAIESMKGIWQRTIIYTLLTTIVAAFVSVILYLLIKPSNVHQILTQATNALTNATQGSSNAAQAVSNATQALPNVIQALPNATQTLSNAAQALPNATHILNATQVLSDTTPVISNAAVPEIHYIDHLITLIPNNIFSPFLEHQVMGVLLVGMLIGFAIRYIPDTGAKKTVGLFFKGAHSIFLVITHWVVAIIPIGLYGFITTTVVQLRDNMDFRGIGEYLSIVILANLIQGFVILPLWLKFNQIKPFEAMRGMLPALSIAFFSKSSAGTLPVTIDAAEKNLKIDPKISRFVLPLCTTINMNGCAAFIAATVLYLMQNQGTEITMGLAILWVGISTIAAVGNAGVPMGCFFLSASLLASMNVPITLLGIILPFYSLIDMVETALNVWSDSCVAKVVNEKASHALLNLEPIEVTPSVDVDALEQR